MADARFTYTDADGTELRITPDFADIHVSLVDQDGIVDTVRVPHYVVATLARELLAAAGDTGHRVISEEDLGKIRDACELRGSLAMRELAARTAYDDLSTENAVMADAIRALPLLGGDTADDAPRVYSQHDLDVLERAAMASAASSMRLRAARLAAEGRHWGDLLANEINELPLLPGTQEATVRCVIRELRNHTGQTITPEAAERVTAHLLNGRDPSHPLAYVVRCIDEAVRAGDWAQRLGLTQEDL